MACCCGEFLSVCHVLRMEPMYIIQSQRKENSFFEAHFFEELAYSAPVDVGFAQFLEVAPVLIIQPFYAILPVCVPLASSLLELHHVLFKLYYYLLATASCFYFYGVAHREVFDAEHSSVVVLHLVIGPISVATPSTATVCMEEKTSVATKFFNVDSMHIKLAS